MNVVGGVPVHVAGETLLCVDAGLAATQRNHGILRSAAQRRSAAARTRGRAEVIARDRTGRRALVPAQLKVQTKQPPRGPRAAETQTEERGAPGC